MASKQGPYYASKAYREEQEEQTQTTPEPTEETESEFPKHTGGGWYELSNGEKIQGQEKAEAEEAKLS